MLTGFIGHILPLFFYFAEWINYTSEVQLGNEVSKPVFPNLPPIFIGTPWIVTGFLLIIGVQFGKLLERKACYPRVFKLFPFLLSAICFSAFPAIIYLINILPQSTQALFSKQ
ncbi:MAG: hypothetical protein A3D92_03450 [Bacteroidetes bacterium RIFCSPHIGHO2_02_FULL_44_7]|nr:MAG: hypothetical protein A3D92_03450 [Bacteroidetes bacterium RIFCSPHIGHO2_02_FULL_44_7]